MSDLPVLPPKWEWVVQQVAGEPMYWLRSPDGVHRAMERTPEQAILAAMDALWCTIAGALT
jgi:hypothetical protein